MLQMMQAATYEEGGAPESILALQEISAAATQVSEVMSSLLTTADSMCSKAPHDFIEDVFSLREIGAEATKVTTTLAEPVPPATEVTYTDTTLERARRLASLTYELIEDIELATDYCGDGHALAQQEAEVELLHDVSSTTERVIEQMDRLQGESWAVGVLALIHQEMEGSGTDGEDTKEDEAALAAVMAQDAQVLDGQDPRIALMLRRTLARVRGESNGFDEAEKEDLHASFLRFKVPASADIHKDDLDALLNFIGRWVPPEEAITDMARKITMYDYMDFDEFLQFMTHYDEFERAEQERIFKKYDQDGSGNISIAELRALLSGLGMIPCRQMMQEALAVVDKNWDGELNFEELCCFLAIYRGSEGFTKEEVENLHVLFDSCSVVETVQSGRQELPVEPKLAGRHLPSLLIQAFGMQVADNVEELQQQLASGQGFRKTATSEATGEGSETATISFKEFLILARRTREMEMLQLSKEMPGMLNTPSTAAKGDFENADTDGNGTISDKELVKFLEGKEFTPLKKVVQEVLMEVAAEAIEGREDLDFNQFFDFLFLYRQRDGFSRQEVEHFRKGFSDYDADGSGSISTLELSDIFREFGYRISVEALHHYIDRVDEDGSNQLDFREFLRLMRWHRESELDNYKRVYTGSKVSVDDAEGIPSGKKLARAIEDLKAIGDHRIIESQVDRLPSEILVDFDMFVDIVDACRHEFVDQEKKKAGFTDDELQMYVDQFNKFAHCGSIEGKELLKLLEAFKWEPKSKQDREVLLQRLNTARHRAREAGAPQVSEDNSGEVGFWEFVQLARELHTLHEKAKEQAMNQLMEECKFNQKEVNQFHEVFHHWYHIDDEGEVDERRMEDDDPNAGLSRETVRRVVRQTGMSFTPEKKEILDKRLDGLEQAGLLRFHGFLRLMRWVIDSDYAEMNAQLAE